MSEQVAAATTETPAAEPQVEAPTSIADHAKSFGPNAEPPTETDGGETDADQTPAQRHHSEQQRREKTGEFKPGKRRERRDLVNRVGQLTATAKTAEEERDALRAELAELKAKQSAPQPPAASTVEHRPSVPQTTASVQPNQRQATPAPDDDPRPDKTDATKYPDGIYDEQYIEDLADWKARGVYRAETAKAAKQRAEHEALQSFGGRIEKARGKYSDFDAVAFGPTNIPQGSAVDLFIMEDEAGPDVLYHLQKHPQERDEILRMPVLAQVKRLTLLSQQWTSSPTPAQAGPTAAAAGPTPVVRPPKPPTAVRTEAQPTVTSPPLDGSLSIRDHAKHFGPSARRA